MKKISLIVLLLIASKIQSQNIDYTIVREGKKEFKNLLINAELMSFDFDWGFNEGTLAIGGTTYFGLTNRIGIEGVARIGYFNMGGSGLQHHIEAGGFMVLKEKTTEEAVEVILSKSFTNGLYKNTTSTNYFLHNTDVITQRGVRAGIYSKSGALGDSDFSGADTDYSTKYTASGVYFGIQKIIQYFVEAKVYGESKYGQKRRRRYIDILYLPVRSLTDEQFALASDESPIGYRYGIEEYYKPFAGSGFRPVVGIEAGVRPFTGLYTMITVGVSF